MGKKGNAKPRKRSTPRDLTPRSTSTVKGARAGDGQVQYLIYKLDRVSVTS